MPFAETWMDLEIFILTKSERERQISYDILYMWKLRRNDTNELIYKQKQIHRHRRQTYSYQRGKGQARDILGVWD